MFCKAPGPGFLLSICQNSYKCIVFLWAILCSVKLLGRASYCPFVICLMYFYHFFFLVKRNIIKKTKQNYKAQGKPCLQNAARQLTKNPIPISLWSFSLFPLKPPTRTNWQHAARQDQILNSSRQLTFSPFSQSLSYSFFFFFYLSLLHLHTTTTTTFISHYCFSLQTTPFPFPPAAAGPSSPLSPASVLPTLSQWVFYDFRESSYWTRGFFFCICLFIYLSQLKLERVLFYFYFYINIIWFSLCLLKKCLNLNLPNMNEYII